MNEEQYELLKKTYALASETNRILHAQRRNAFIGSIVKMAIYMAMIILPFYYLMPYLKTAMDTANSASQKIQEVQGTINKIQGATSQVSGQLQDFNKMINNVQQVIPGAKK
jgi:septal ring factor EnvC (AmiA/AmiB activator)